MTYAQTSLGVLARDLPEATVVFFRHKLDFCCGGERTLSVACTEAGLDVAAVVAELHAVTAAPSREGRWDAVPVPALCDHIEARYHATLRQDVPPLIAAAQKVERVHALKPLVPKGLAAALGTAWDELQAHMLKEERVLFPLLREGRGGMAQAPIGAMRAEHDEHAAHLRALRTLTQDFVAPAHACATWRALYDGLARFERELMEHIHLENHVLFQRAGAGR